MHDLRNNNIQMYMYERMQMLTLIFKIQKCTQLYVIKTQYKWMYVNDVIVR